jgi:hypothetical protein
MSTTKIKVGDLVTKTKLHRRYWHGAAYELDALGYVHDTTYDKGVKRKKGEVRKYKVLRALPTLDALKEEAREKWFTKTVTDSIEDARTEVETVRDEMVEWRDNLEQSEGLSQTSKADEVRESADSLEYIDIPSEIESPPEWLFAGEDDDGNETHPALMVTLPSYLPTWFSWRCKRKRTGRTARLGDSVCVFNECADAIRGHLDSEACDWSDDQKSEAETLEGSLRELASELEGVECPGMY